jgi:hypothetical protein
MRYRYRGLLCEFVKRINGNLLCVDCADKNHWLCYPESEWERAA